MSVLNKNGEVYADTLGYVVGRVIAFFGAVGDVVRDTLKMRRDAGAKGYDGDI